MKSLAVIGAGLVAAAGAMIAASAPELRRYLRVRKM